MYNRIAEWKRIFDTEENAISKALSRMAWDLAAYSCVVEMVREAPEISGKKRLNGRRRQKLSATPDLSGTVLPLCLIPNSA
ncbi:hypothetical protein OLN00_13905, partial [Pseudomonas aeruginosa]